MRGLRTTVIGVGVGAILVTSSLAITSSFVRQDVSAETAYAIGHDLGTQTLARLTEDGVVADREMLIKGFADAVNDAEPAVDPLAMEAMLAQLEREVATRIAEERLTNDPVFRALAEQNLMNSRAFHETFGRRHDVTTLASGVQYRVLQEGSGDAADTADTVVADFEAKLLDDHVFARETGKAFRVDGVIDGARDVLRRMRVGDRFLIAIPPAEAFGIGGRAPDIGPNETVIVEVELVEVR